LYACGNAGNEEASDPATEETTTETAEETSEEDFDLADATWYTVDLENSSVGWKGTMVGVYSHTGEIKLTEGSMSIHEGLIYEGSFTIDAASIFTTDDDALYAMAPRGKLEGHLKSADFLGVEEFPTASLDLIGRRGADVLLTDLTIKGVTNNEEITGVTLTESDGTITVTGSLTFDRQKYGISYEQAGDMVLADDIELTISLSGSAK